MAMSNALIAIRRISFFIVGQGIGLQHTVYLFGMTLAKIQAAGQLTHDDHVEAVADIFFL